MRQVLPALAILAAFAAAALAFAQAQSIWIDETTQLSGLSLPLDQQLIWLTGGANPIPAVPPDRMPPLSYWFGAGWTQIFGLSEMTMRIFGLLAVLCGAPAIYLAARDLGGLRAGWLPPVFALAAIYLSPGMIVQAGAIRAYPIYFAFSAWALWAYLRACARPERKWLVLLAVLSLAAGYTHFFGVVMAALLWLSLLLVRLWRGQNARPVLLGGLATAVLFVGLLPFISAATGISESAPAPVGPAALGRDMARVPFRLLLHGVHLSSDILTGVAVLGAAGLAALSLLTVLRYRTAQGTGLVLPVAFALLVLPLLKLAVGGFDVLAPHYNLWLLPLLALFLSRALASQRFHAIAVACAGLLIGAHLVADYRLLRHADFYTHGSGEWVTAAIGDPESTIIIHNGEGGWGYDYFPVRYLTDGRVKQILRHPGQLDQEIVPGGFTELEKPISDFTTRIYVSSRSLGSREVAARLSDPGDCGIPPMQPESGNVVETRSRCGYESTTMVIVRD